MDGVNLFDQSHHTHIALTPLALNRESSLGETIAFGTRVLLFPTLINDSAAMSSKYPPLPRSCGVCVVNRIATHVLPWRQQERDESEREGERGGRKRMERERERERERETDRQTDRQRRERQREGEERGERERERDTDRQTDKRLV